MKQILCFGDSNTYGLIPAANGRYPWQERWTGILQEQVSHRGYRIVEEGLCGRTTVFEDALRAGRRGNAMLPILLETHNPIDTVILMLGTNDCKARYDASAGVIGLGVKELIKQIKAVGEKIKILLVSPILLGADVWNGFDPEFNQESVAVSGQLKDAYKKVAEEEGVFFLAASDYAAASPDDRQHLDKEGHRALAQAISEKLTEVL